MDRLTEPAHPSVEVLRSFGLGQLGEAEASAVEEHVGHCEACCRTLAEAGSDTFTDLLRRGGLAGVNGAATLAAGSPPPAADGTRASADSSDESAWDGPPPALLRHPRYRVLGLIGAGGMGAVYKAEHRLMERLVALKVMTRALVASEATVDRFRREVKAAARLAHPNIVAAYDAEQAGDLHFLVMEHVEGTDLARWLARHGPLPVEEACEYARQCAAGLQHAHEHGMIHRDVKPHNLMRTPGGTVKILDFGLARLAAEAGAVASGVTGEGTLLGTVDYLAPEQADDARRADIRSDIYSLGCTLYHLLCGRPPFPKGSVVQKVMAHTEREPLSIRELRPDVPPRLARVVQRMMAKSPDDRYQTPDEVGDALAPFVGQTVVIDPTPLRKKDAAGGKESGRSPRRRWPVAVAAAFLLALVGVVAGAAVYRVKTDNGELVITTDNPDVEVVIKQNGKLVRIIDTKTSKEVTLNSGLYDLEVKGNPEDLKLSLDKVTIRRGETVVATVDRRKTAAGKKPAAEKIVEVRRLMWQDGPAGAVVFTPDGKTVAVTSDKTVRRWDVAGGKEGTALTGHQSTLYDLVVSPDGKTAATADAGGAVKLWDLATGKEGKALPGHSNQARGLALSPDGKLLYSGGADEKVVRAWEVGSGKLATEFEHPNAIRTLALSPDGKVLAVATFYDGAVKLWDTAAQKELRTLDASKETINALAFAADGKSLLTAGADRVIRRWETDSGKLLKALDEQGAPIETLARTPDGRFLLSGGGDWKNPDQPGEVIVWDLTAGKKAHTLAADGGCVFGVAVAADGRTFATGQPSGARLWRLPAPPAAEKVGEVRRFGWGHAIQGAALSPDGRLAVAGGADGSVRLWDLGTGKELRRLPGHAGWAYAVAFTPDGKGVISAGRDAVLRLSDVATGKEVRLFEGHDHGLVRVALSADGRLLLSGDDAGGVSLWEVETGKRLLQLAGHTGMVHALAFAPDAKTAASSGGDGTIRWWDLETGKEVRRGEAATSATGLAFAPDGRQLLSAHADGTLRWWDAGTGKELRKFAVQSDTLQAVALSADGRRAVAGGGGDISDGGFKKGTDFALRLWDVTEGKELTPFTGHEDIVNVVALSRDGRYALTGSNDRTTRLWRLPDPPPAK
jgi:WD40 repeat protein